MLCKPPLQPKSDPWLLKLTGLDDPLHLVGWEGRVGKGEAFSSGSSQNWTALEVNSVTGC